MHYRQLSVLSVLATAPLGYLGTPHAPLWDDMLVKHMWHDVPPKWESLGPPAASTTIDLHFALKPHRENALVDALFDVSDPSRSTYGAHLSKELVAELVAPHPDTLDLIKSWLEHHNLSSSISKSMTHGGGWLTVAGVPVSHADDLLGASYQLYRHTDTNETIIRTVSYALPAVLHSHVQIAAPTTFFAPQRTQQQTPRKFSKKEAVTMANATSGEPLTKRLNVDYIDPQFLRWLYNTVSYVPTIYYNVLAVVGFQDQFASQRDLTAFMTEFRRDAIGAGFLIVPVNNGRYDQNRPTFEASMDIQYAEAMAYPVPHIYYSVGGQMESLPGSHLPSPGDSYLEWLNYLLSQQFVPQTITISYAIAEQAVPREYAEALCDLFAKLGARGASVLFASGDYGVGRPADCLVREEIVQFVPYFPASCPYITSVGGTTGFAPEVAVSLSGGGFSNYFGRPPYQDVAVPAYLQRLGNLHRGSYNPTGRGIPDIAAQALNFQFISGSENYRMNGTSCSTPTVAGVIALLNDYLLLNGRAPLGFLNPWLYSLGHAGLNDIRFGCNPGCGTEGFCATNGWDPVTGLGTPNFRVLQYIIYLWMQSKAGGSGGGA